MSKVVVSEFITLDGVFQDPGGVEEIDGGGWAFRFERGGHCEAQAARPAGHQHLQPCGTHDRDGRTQSTFEVKSGRASEPVTSGPASRSLRPRSRCCSVWLKVT
jgi:hypothetical protein